MEKVTTERPMAEHKKLYICSEAEGRDYHELDLWQESHKENCKCARAIEDAIASSFDGRTLQSDCAAGIIARFGFNRVNFVLANTVREKSYDGRFSPGNKDWSQTIHVPRNDSNWAFTVDSHPAVLNGFIDLTRKAWAELGLYDQSHCVDPKDSLQDYTGKVLVVSPHWLKDPYKTPEFQLFYAECGFGCSPTASGRKVFGQFLYDGEQTHLNRGDFIGILKDEHLPDWASSRLQEILGQNEVSAAEQTM